MSAKTESYLLPRALQPVGLTHTRHPRFAWKWLGPDVVWELVLFDEAMDEVLRVAGIRSQEYLARGALAAALAVGDRFHWCVEAEISGHRFRCPLAALSFTR